MAECFHLGLSGEDLMNPSKATFIQYSRAVFAQRWQRLNAIMKFHGEKVQRFALRSEVGTWFAWVECLEWKQGDESCLRQCAPT